MPDSARGARRSGGGPARGTLGGSGRSRRPGAPLEDLGRLPDGVVSL